MAELRIAGPAAPWRAIGFAVGPDDRCPIGAVVVRLGAPGRGIVGWALTGEGDGDVDGIPTEWGASAGDASPHPNTAVSVDHVVLRSADPGATFAALECAGMQLRGERVAPAPGGSVRQGFFRHGEAIVEVVGPERPTATGPSMLWGLTVTVADIDACAALLGAAVGVIRPAVQPGRRIATVARESGIGVPLAVMSS